jgi:hypothetical protein
LSGINFQGPVLRLVKYGGFALKILRVAKLTIMTLSFKKSANFFAENCDHNIGPCTIPYERLAFEMFFLRETHSPLITNLIFELDFLQV